MQSVLFAVQSAKVENNIFFFFKIMHNFESKVRCKIETAILKKSGIRSIKHCIVYTKYTKYSVYIV